MDLMTSEPPKRALVAFSSLSGNTHEVARYVSEGLKVHGWDVQWFEIGYHDFEQVRGQDYDLVCLGSFSVDEGRTPGEVKRFIAEWTDQAMARPPVAIFGTGDTQWGEEFYCGAARRMARFFKSPFEVLEIEQMPHSDKDRSKIKSWVDHVLSVMCQQIEKELS